MKNVKLVILFIGLLVIFCKNYGQSIPFGVSIDTVKIKYDKVFFTDSINSPMYEKIDTIAFTEFQVYYYKPSNYDSTTSPILWGVHGLGGNGSSEINNLQSIANHRQALIVSLTMKSSWDYNYCVGSTYLGNFYFLYYFVWYQSVFKQVYKHVLFRENRNSIPVHLIGFSAGGQCVSRYMLIRQGIPDSIPIKMAVSSNPYSYTFATTDTIDSVYKKCESFDTTYYNVVMYYPYGLVGNIWGDTTITTSFFNCNDHVIQYYNENYAVLIGTADTACGSMGPANSYQGQNRFQRAQNFYHFSDSDAVVRGTTLKWQYGEAPGVGHDGYLMYNTILAGDSIPLAERLLFETPYHTVPNIAPHANFTADTTIVVLPNASVQFYNNSINANSFLWDFGDSTNSTAFSPSHTYMYADTFNVILYAISDTGCENKLIKNNFIIVKESSSITDNIVNSEGIQIYPNPSEGNITIRTDNEPVETIGLFNSLGESVDIKIIQENKSSFMINPRNLKGMYFVKVKTRENIYNGKIIIK